MQGHRNGPDGLVEGAGPRQLAKYGGDPGQGAAFRAHRYFLRGLVRKLAWWVSRHEGHPPTWQRTANCGLCVGAAVELRCTCNGGVYPCNIETCGNFWACPVCMAKITVRRAAEVDAGAAAWVAEGGSLGLLTLTVRHGSWMDLRDVLGALTGSWRKLRMRKEYRRLRLLIIGSVKALEVTFGPNGPHPHLHNLLFIKPGVSEGEVRDCCEGLIPPWCDLVVSVLGVSPSSEHGVDFTANPKAGYVAKMGLEIASPGTKKGNTVFGMLEDAANGDADSFFRCIEFFDTMRGRHSLDWSPGLRSRLGLGVEKSDEDVALEDEDGLHVGWVDRDVWNRALYTTDESGVPLVAEILRIAEENLRKIERLPNG